MKRLLVLLLLFGACSGEPEQAEPTREQAEAAARPSLPEQEPAPEDGVAIGVELHLSGLSPLYRSFFANPDARRHLGQRLHGQVSDPAQLRVAWEESRRQGRISLDLLPGGFPRVERDGDRLRLGALAPLTRALALYRDELASRFDLRIRNFQVQLVSIRGAQACTFGITGGNPPDGRTVSPCVELDGESHCGQPEDDGWVRFGHGLAERLATCLDAS